MKDKDKNVDPLPDSFKTEEEAGAFWDAHSTMDYQESLESSDDTLEISERVSRCTTSAGLDAALQPPLGFTFQR